MRTPLLLLVPLMALASSLEAQQPRTIAPGQTMDEVRGALGPPNVVREADGWTYFFYTNRCLPRCGTDDTVFFREGRVVSAVLHAPSRRYSGPAAAAALGRETAAEPSRTGGTATVTGSRVRTAEPPEEAPVNLGVVGSRLRAPARADTSSRGEIVSVDTVYVPAASAAPSAPQAAPAQPTPPRPPAPPVGRPREEGVEANTIRRPPPR
jgi:hypothetical protein